MTTKQAWKSMIREKGIEKKLGITLNYLWVLRAEMNNGNYPSNDGMEEHLKKAGWKVVVERQWEEKK
jgi:hypothetical protein